jgi:large subunit ribosomal protein L22
MKAELTNYRQSPRKVRLIANLVTGKSVPQALGELAFLVKRGAHPVHKLISSAAANAKANHGIDADKLMVKSVVVNKGLVMKRVSPRARGAAYVIKKRSSHISVVLDTRKEVSKKGSKKVAAKVEAAPEKKEVKAKSKKATTTK